MSDIDVEEDFREVTRESEFGENAMPGSSTSENMVERLLRVMINESRNTNNAYHIMPDLTKNIKTYNGGAGAKDWIEKLKSMRLLHQWSDAFALETHALIQQEARYSGGILTKMK